MGQVVWSVVWFGIACGAVVGLAARLALVVVGGVFDLVLIPWHVARQLIAERAARRYSERVHRAAIVASSGVVGELVCRCGRSQALAPAGVPGGVTLKEAERIGWSAHGDGARCPECSREAA